MTLRATVAAVLLVVASAAPVGAAAMGSTQSGSATAGTFVSFEAQNDAVADYTVNGATVVDSVAVQSAQEARNSGGLGANVDLKAVTDFSAAGLSLQSEFGASAESKAVVSSSSGAEMRVNDNDRGVLVVSSGGESQYVRANLSSGASAQQDGQQRVVVSKEDGTEGAFLVVGDGQVTVNEAGNVTAEVGQDGKLVYRQYNEGRSDDEQHQERLITSGTATAEVYYQQAEQSGDEGEQRAANVVRYSEDTTVEVTEKSANRLNVTVERAQSEGKVVITSLSEQAFESAGNAQVTVDGEAATEVDSYSAVESAAQGGDKSAFTVHSSSSAQASTDVVVGINHFSAREVSIQSDDSGSGDGTDTGGQPGFGVFGALAALGAALVALHRRSL